ncbi:MULTISPECIES: hypothetical protein [Paraburkholderia]|uniref:Uncharacterized protein n=1 Tax=Paraburkholderia ferrariae TaxID=386056 RepID=A0ABU9S0L1_9BURK
MVVPGMGIQRDLDRRVMVMGMMLVTRDIAMRAAQHLGHHRRDHTQQDGKHPEPGTDLLTVAVEHVYRRYVKKFTRNVEPSPLFTGGWSSATSLQQAVQRLGGRAYQIFRLG